MPLGPLLGGAVEETQLELLLGGVQWVVCFGLCVIVVERSYTPLCLVSLSGVTLRCVSVFRVSESNTADHNARSKLWLCVYRLCCVIRQDDCRQNIMHHLTTSGNHFQRRAVVGGDDPADAAGAADIIYEDCLHFAQSLLLERSCSPLTQCMTWGVCLYAYQCRCYLEVLS
jgi:hypothetical protein